MAALKLYALDFPAMGTNCALQICASSSDAAEDGFRVAVAEIQRIERRYSRYRADSDLSQINRVAQAGGSIRVDDETAGLLNYAFAAYQRSGGLFDITSGLLRKAWDFKSGRLPAQEALDQLLPYVGLEKVRWEPPDLSFTKQGMEIDLGGLAKEYAADRVADVCSAAGILHGLVDLGGDIRVIGPKPDGQPWQIAIRHPRIPGAFIVGASLAQGGLATSGDYERCIQINGYRYGHILHPLTGWPVQRLSSVSVIADQCLVAGTLCTIAMLKSDQGPAWLESLGLPHFWVDKQDKSNHLRWPVTQLPANLAA
jgi:thiamine biosynthesis lipoprotein